jgi:hypothetical protein
MVWVYEDSQFTADEQKVFKFLRKRTKNAKVAERAVKMLSLYAYLRHHKVRSAKQLEHLAFYDKQHTRPIFNEKTAKVVFKSLKQRGGLSATHPATDTLIRDSIGYIQSWLPDLVTGPANSLYGMVTGPLVSIEESMPLIRTILKLVKVTTKVGDSAISNVATNMAGAVGEAVVAIPLAIAGASVAITSVLEDDLGGAVAVISGAVPFIGSTLTTLVDTYETMNRPEPQPVPTAGKRFSTRRRNLLKCPKTRRNKCAMF